MHQRRRSARATATTRCWRRSSAGSGSRLSADEIDKFRDEDGLLNEFKLAWQLRDRFPLHLIVFKQTACHLCHEANVEQIFSRAGLLTDPNIDQDFLATLVSVSCNKSAFMPSVAAIKAKYFELFRGSASGEGEGEEMEGEEEGEEAAAGGLPGSSAQHAGQA